MFPAERLTTHRSGQAVVRLRDNREYEGTVDIAGGFVHFTGRRRVREIDGITYRHTDARSWPHQRILEVRWLEKSLVPIEST